MSVTAKVVSDDFRKLPASEQQELLQQLLRMFTSLEPASLKPFPTVKVGDGAITSQQVADALDDE
jgi:hypothetical protein